MEGESGRNELLRGPFALFGVRISAKLVRDLAKHRRTPMSPSAIDSAYFPGSVFHRGRNTQAEVFDTGHGPFRALIVSNLKWGGPCRGHYVFPQTLSSPADPNHNKLSGIKTGDILPALFPLNL